MLRSTTLEITIKILVAAEQEQHPRMRIPFICKQHLLAVERKLVDVYAGQVALFRLADLWIGDDRAHRVVHHGLVAGGELFVYPLERGHLQYGDVNHGKYGNVSRVGEAGAFWLPPSSQA